MPALFPQIDLLEARRCLQEFRNRGSEEFTPRLSSPRQTFSPLGGSPVREGELRNLRDGVVQIASAAGWPRKVSNAPDTFDPKAARYLHETMGVTAHEASRSGVWQFLCCVVLPDVVAWRFPPGSEAAVESRFLGGNRNTLGRLWWRAEILKEEGAADPYHLLDEMHEDELVQIIERSSIAGSRSVARAMAVEFLASVISAERRKESPLRMELMRDAAKRILRVGAVISFDVLDEEQAAAFARIEIAHAFDALRKHRELNGEASSARKRQRHDAPVPLKAAAGDPA